MSVERNKLVDYSRPAGCNKLEDCNKSVARTKDNKLVANNKLVVSSTRNLEENNNR